MSTRGRVIDARKGQYFQHARERAGLDQKRAVEALGLSIGTLSRYENGRVPIPDDTAARMAALYLVAPDGWREAGDRPGDGTEERTGSVPFVYDDPRYWSARWDQSVAHLRRLLLEQEELANDMREAVYGGYRRPAATPPVTPERLEQRIADQIPPDASGTDDPVRAQG
ncbi:helix-turn-helix domain-containing protein [Gemmatimonas sp.]